MNIIIITGRLTRDPEVRYSSGENQIAVAKFTLAVNRSFKKDEADFINCKAFGKLAEIIEKYCIKGTKLQLRGRLEIGSYNSKDGVKINTAEVIVDEMEFLEKKTNDGDYKPVIDEEYPFN